jgi:DNA-binding response OmpR family regulator
MMSIPAKVSAEAGEESDQNRLLRVLVVEDDEVDAFMICRALSEHPAVGAVLHARDGVEALRLVEQDEIAPNLAFIDLKMPRKGGLSLLVALAERPAPGFPIVILTSSSAPIDAMRGRLRGALRVVCKPTSIKVLEAELAAVVDATCKSRLRSKFEGEFFKARFHGIPATQHLIAAEEGLDL